MSIEQICFNSKFGFSPLCVAATEHVHVQQWIRSFDIHRPVVFADYEFIAQVL